MTLASVCQVGIALGFQIPTLLVPDVKDLQVVERGLKTLSYGVAAVTTIVLAAVLIGESCRSNDASEGVSISNYTRDQRGKFISGRLSTEYPL